MLDVQTATETVLATRGDAIGVVTMSALAFWGEPRADDFRLMNLMGSACSIGLGIALGKPDRDVWVIDGDGSLLMQLGVLAAIADAQPPNLTLVLVDNGVYAVSGAQPTPGPVDWPALLLAAGLVRVTSADTQTKLHGALCEPGTGPRAVVARCERERPAYPGGRFPFISSSDEAARVRRTLTSSSS